jgi:hypothetical protein
MKTLAPPQKQHQQVMALGIITIILMHPYIITLPFQPGAHTKLRGVVQCICNVHWQQYRFETYQRFLSA